MPAAAPIRLALPPRAPGVPEVRLRPFGGTSEDLAVDFARPASPALVTDVLACCAEVEGAGDAADAVEGLPVPTRLECLVALAGMERAELEVPLRCPNPDCGEPMEVVFTVDELLEIAAAAPAADALEVEAGGARVEVRPPTGADQAAWLAAGYAGEAEAVRGVAATLLRGDAGQALTPAALAAADEALEALDPLTALTVAAACPCGETSVHEVDVAALALARLAGAQARTVEEVHLLACHYHWSEAQVLAVPARRRARYLALLEREAR